MPIGVYIHKRGYKLSEETRLRQSKARKGHPSYYSAKGSDNNKWKGEKASYRAKHIWMETNYGKPETCENCGKVGLSGHQIHWANISGEYKREREDWKRLCVSCHGEYDANKRNSNLEVYA